jgi:lipopolysaccharide transport protein LptA
VAGSRAERLAVALLGALLLARPVAAADERPALPGIAPADTSLPIDLDAAFSELDRRNNRLIFRQLNIRQGALAIRADEATADPADFENSLWVFTGNVKIVNGGTSTDCDRAELTFRDNQLRTALLTGQPARFRQAATGQERPTEGRGGRIRYDLEAATIEISDDAWLSDGKSEIAGSRIAYDIRREVVTAGGANGGQVRMRITPEPKPGTPPPAGSAPPPAGSEAP